MSDKEEFQPISKIPTKSQVITMTYDLFVREILFVEKDHPHKIQSVNLAVNSRTVIEESSIDFKAIALDTITSNIYYMDKGVKFK